MHFAGGMLVNSIKNQMGTERILDVRGLEQPEPLLRALAALDTLGNGEYLRLLSDRDPVLLYPLLDQHQQLLHHNPLFRTYVLLPRFRGSSSKLYCLLF